MLALPSPKLRRRYRRHSASKRRGRRKTRRSLTMESAKMLPKMLPCSIRWSLTQRGGGCDCSSRPPFGSLAFRTLWVTVGFVGFWKGINLSLRRSSSARAVPRWRTASNMCGRKSCGCATSTPSPDKTSMQGWAPKSGEERVAFFSLTTRGSWLCAWFAPWRPDLCAGSSFPRQKSAGLLPNSHPLIMCTVADRHWSTEDSNIDVLRGVRGYLSDYHRLCEHSRETSVFGKESLESCPWRSLRVQHLATRRTHSHTLRLTIEPWRQLSVASVLRTLTQFMSFERELLLSTCCRLWRRRSCMRRLSTLGGRWFGEGVGAERCVQTPWFRLKYAPWRRGGQEPYDKVELAGSPEGREGGRGLCWLSLSRAKQRSRSQACDLWAPVPWRSTK